MIATKYLPLSRKKQREKMQSVTEGATGSRSSVDNPQVYLRSSLHRSTSLSVTSNTGVFNEVCSICKKEGRKHKGVRQKLILSTKDLEQPILDIVLTLNHQELITKLEIRQGTSTNL